MVYYDENEFIPVCPSSMVFLSFTDPYQISANLLLETEDIKQNIGKLNKEVWDKSTF